MRQNCQCPLFYDINKINDIGHGAVVSESPKGDKDSHIKTNTGDNRVSQNEPIVKNNSMQEEEYYSVDGDEVVSEQYSIATDKNGNEYWQIESEKDIFKGLQSVGALKKAAFNYILNGDKGDKVFGLIDGKNLEFVRVSAKEYVYGVASQKLSEEAYKQKMRMSTSIIDLIDNASISYDAPDHKNHKMFPNGFKNYQGRVGIDDTIFRYIVRVGKAKNGMIFYDINLEVDGKVPRANRTSLIKSSTSKNNVPQSDTVVNSNSIPVKENYSLTDEKLIDGYSIKDYNNRGWAMSLLHQEDIMLLNEKIKEAFIDKKDWFGTLSDGTYIFEVNNKLLYVSGTFKNPVIESVLYINADSVADVEIAKGLLNHERNYKKRTRNSISRFLETVEDRVGSEFLRVYSREDYAVSSSDSQNQRRAAPPEGFGSFGYYRDYKNRGGDLQGVGEENEQLDEVLTDEEKYSSIDRKDTPYSYDSLVAKPDMTVTPIDDSTVYQSNKENRKQVVEDAVKNAAAIGYSNQKGKSKRFSLLLFSFACHPTYQKVTARFLF